MIFLLYFQAVQANVFTSDLRNNVDFQKLLAHQNLTHNLYDFIEVKYKGKISSTSNLKEANYIQGFR